MDVFTILNDCMSTELMIMIPVLYIIGRVIKGYEGIDSRHIPVILGIISIVSCALYLFATIELSSLQDILGCLFSAIAQGILYAGATVYGNELVRNETTAG